VVIAWQILGRWHQAGPWAHGSTAQKKNASTATNGTAIATVITTRRGIDMAVERRAIEVETTPMPVTPATAAEMKHWVSQVEAEGRDTARGYTCAAASHVAGD